MIISPWAIEQNAIYQQGQEWNIQKVEFKNPVEARAGTFIESSNGCQMSSNPANCWANYNAMYAQTTVGIKSYESADEEYNTILVELKECADKQAKGFNVDHCPQGISNYQIEYEIYSYGDGSYAKALDNVVFQILSGDNKCADTKQILKDLKNVVDSFPNAPQIDFFAEYYEKGKSKYDNKCSG